MKSSSRKQIMRHIGFKGDFKDIKQGVGNQTTFINAAKRRARLFMREEVRKILEQIQTPMGAF